jgi:hypothetical protein
MNPCDNLISFVDGQLDAGAADAFRAHLRTCATCPDHLVEAVQLSAHLSTLPPPAPKPQVPAPAPPGELPSTSVADPAPPRPLAMSWNVVALSAGLAAVIAATVAWWHHHRVAVGSSATSVVTVASSSTPGGVYADLQSQPYEIRLAYSGADTWRPVRDAMLGSGAALEGTIPHAVLAPLERRGDRHGLAIASLWNGRKPGEVSQALSAIEQTEPVRSDRAAMAVLTTDAANAEPVLAELEALRDSKDPLVARAARWNHALVLARLDLPLAAAQAFQDIADQHEAGWGDDAARRAQQQLQIGNAPRETWQRAFDAGQALVAAGTAVPRALVGEIPGMLRAYLYNAVRTAPSAERVRALAALAAQLDQLGDPGQHILTDYVQRVARVDFARRAPLAAGYAALLRGAPVPDPIAAQLTTETDDDAVADIVLGAMIERDVRGEVIAPHRLWFARRIHHDQDPWFQLVLARAEADVEKQAGNPFRAQAILHEVKQLCTPALRYQCLAVDRSLGEVYADLHQVPAALTLLRRTVADARAVGEWGRYENVLMALADVERFHGATATVRAYVGELQQMPTPCSGHQVNYRRLAGAAIVDTDGRAARDYLARALALPCARTDLASAVYFSEIATLDPRPDDFAQLQRMLGTLPAGIKASAGNQALTAALEGRVAIATERDRAGGVALLEKAIAVADARRGDAIADQARSAAYNMLAFDAAHGSDLTGAMNLVARDLRQPPPHACSVAMTAEVLPGAAADGRCAERPRRSEPGAHRLRARRGHGGRGAPGATRSAACRAGVELRGASGRAGEGPGAAAARRAAHADRHERHPTALPRAAAAVDAAPGCRVRHDPVRRRRDPDAGPDRDGRRHRDPVPHPRAARRRRVRRVPPRAVARPAGARCSGRASDSAVCPHGGGDPRRPAPAPPDRRARGLSLGRGSSLRIRALESAGCVSRRRCAGGVRGSDRDPRRGVRSVLCQGAGAGSRRRGARGGVARRAGRRAARGSTQSVGRQRDPVRVRTKPRDRRFTGMQHLTVTPCHDRPVAFPGIQRFSCL